MPSPKKGKDSSPAESVSVDKLVGSPLPKHGVPAKGKGSSPADSFNPGERIKGKKDSWKPERGTPASFG